MSVRRQPGAIQRRTFLQGTALAGSAALLVPGLLAGRARAGGPKRGGHLVLALDGASATDSLDPATYTATYMQTVGYQWGNCLVEIDEKVRPVPELAESWEPSPDATTWVFKIRRGVTFHNGKELDAEDVVYSIDHHRGEDSKSGAKGYLTMIRAVRATDKYEVTFELDSPYADLPYVLSDYHLLIVPKGTDFARPIGTGPFVIREFEPGVRTYAERNPNYWKEGRGWADSVETLAINDPTARIAALQAGQAHFVNNPDPKTAKLLARAPGVKLIDVPGAGHRTFAMRTDTPPFDDNHLRLALKWGIDRREILEKVLNGFGRVGNDQPIPDFDPFFNAELPQRTFDPEKAAFHWKKADVTGRIPLHVADAAWTGAVDAAQLYREHLAKAGIELEVIREPNDGYWSNVWMKKPFVGSYWGGRPTADLMLSVAYRSDAPWNETFWKRPEFDALLDRARGELDPEKRRELYWEAQRMIWQEGGEVIPVFNNHLYGARDDIDGFVAVPVLTGLRAAEQLYFTDL